MQRVNDQAPADGDAAGATVPSPLPRKPIVTAIPGDRDASTLVLICDHCGRTYPDPSPEWAGLWQAATADGWGGRGRPVGPHRCQVCAA